MSKIQRLYNLKVVKSGKRLEVFKYSLPIREGIESNNKEGRRGKRELTEEEKKFNKERKRKETLFNARNNIIRLIASNSDLQTFITLTYQENMQDIKLSKKHLNLFFKKLQRDYKYLKYLYVFELQKRGAIHYHILLNLNALDNKFNIKTANTKEKKPKEQRELENNFKARYWQFGFIDIRNLHQEGNSNIAKYVSCYLVEDLFNFDMQGNKVYGFSRNLDKPITEKLETKDQLEDLISLDNYELKFINQYDLYYTNKLNQEVKGQVNYFDYVKKE